LLPVGEKQWREFDEFAMKVVVRNGASDPIDEGFVQELLHIAMAFRFVAFAVMEAFGVPK
jgi:hypothetical protein